MDTRSVVDRFLAAVERRDVAAAAACFADEAPYQNVPHDPVRGPEGVTTMLERILERSTEVRWEIVTASYGPGRAHLERIDRFVIDGVEHAVACHGVIEVDEGSGLITALRDYSDLGPWREEITPVLDPGR